MRNFLLMMAASLAVILGASTTAMAASLVAHVDISAQTMTVKKYGRVVHRWKVSTARRGYVTPRGTWRPTRMHTMWHSRKYDMSPMPHSIFYYKGYAIHGTNAISRLGRPASHGCVRLHPANARKLFSMVKQVGPGNVRIVVTN
ncbi:MAG: L,D-transpeptidase [Rhizobiaceae bacterium]